MLILYRNQITVVCGILVGDGQTEVLAQPSAGACPFGYVPFTLPLLKGLISGYVVQQ
jgi:hypothetical protein